MKVFVAILISFSIFIHAKEEKPTRNIAIEVLKSKECQQFIHQKLSAQSFNECWTYIDKKKLANDVLLFMKIEHWLAKSTQKS